MRDLIQSALHKRYQIERELGRGGMGAVYLAQDLQLQRPVAIKVLPPELAVQSELRERFLRETRMAAGFSHPNIVPVHAVEEHPRFLCFVMGFIEGETLGQRVRRAGPLSAAEAARMLQEVAWALSYAHGRGVVHRDVKPDNILIERATGRSVVTDFGIARSTAAATTSLTQVGEVVGTPQFMSPEQAAGETLDGRSDLYALGVVAFFAVTGRLPFEADSAGAVMAMHLTQPPPRVATLRAALPQALAAAIDRCLEKDPAKRFESGEALASALDPVRALRREIAPAIRMFHAQAGAAFRVLVIVGLVALTVAGGENANSSLDRAVPLVFGGAIIWGVFAQVVGRARYLLRTGFSFDEVRAGMLGVFEERLEARAQERADPASRRRESLRLRVMIAAGLWGVLGPVWVWKTMRTRVSDHSYSTSLPGVVILFASLASFGLAIAMLMMNPGRATGVERLITRLWTGPVGRALFRLASWRLGDQPAGGFAVSANTGSGPLSLIAALPLGTRRELGGARAGIERLEQALRALAERQRSLEDAIAEAGTATPAADAALEARRAELLRDLVRSRDDAVTRRERLGSALENVRLQLLRLKSGVGSAADVAAELRSAEGFAA